MKNVKKQVKKFKKEFDIKGVPDVSELRQVIRSFHYQLLTYEGNEELLVNLNQFERSKYVPSFCCSKNRQNYLFYSAKVHDSDLPFVLAHEIGHIYMNHLNREKDIHDTPEYKDRETNEFASELLQEKTKRVSMKIPFSALILSVALLIGSFTVDNISQFATSVKTPAVNNFDITETVVPEDTTVQKQNQSNQQNIKTPLNETVKSGETQIENYIEEPISETVVVTRTGKRYHRPSCWHLNNREGLRNVNLEQAVLEKYTPCSDCYKS